MRTGCHQHFHPRGGRVLQSEQQCGCLWLQQWSWLGQCVAVDRYHYWGFDAKRELLLGRP